MSIPALNRGEVVIAFVDEISHACGMVPTLSTVTVYVVPSFNVIVGPGEVMLDVLLPNPY